MKTTFKCSHGHVTEVDLPDSFFINSSLIFPCSECDERYLVNKNGESELFIDEPYHKFSFIAMHY